MWREVIAYIVHRTECSEYGLRDTKTDRKGEQNSYEDNSKEKRFSQDDRVWKKQKNSRGNER